MESNLSWADSICMQYFSERFRDKTRIDQRLCLIDLDSLNNHYESDKKDDAENI